MSNAKARRLTLTILAAAGIAAAAYAGLWRTDLQGATPKGPPPAPPAVPAEVSTAQLRSVPIYLTGIGTVEPFNTVTVHSRVDGELQQVLFHEGQDLKKGDLLVVIDPRTFEAALDQAKARLEQDTASLDNAQLDLTRDVRLGKSDFVSEQTTDSQRSTVAQLTAQIAQDRAMISTAQTQLSYTQIASPIDGRAGLRLIDQGNIVHATDTTGLVVINQLHPITVISTLPQAQVPAIRAALAAGKVEAQAISREDRTVLDVGIAELTDNQIDPQSGTLRVKSVFPNKTDRLWPGQFVDVKLRVATLADALTVPSDAIQRGPDGEFVFVVDKDEKVTDVPVKVANISDGIAVIDSGLKAGQRVVVRGQYRLARGTRIAPTPMAGG
ncbi:efflux RND transporter periplasmic adaptor subunit [Xanthobacter sp. DSM 24535]|uniref:efflux RND transporter periplasmic adaptor subunit n=1 Tax=Roseixanthobacter psychrophilus TaxID=3119917 RepID=UPI00372AE350